MRKGVLKLQFIKKVGGKYDPGDIVTMPVEEYIALMGNTHPTNVHKVGPDKGKPVPLDPRLRHTKVIEGEELLEKALEELAEEEAKSKAPTDMTINQCKAELTEKGVDFGKTTLLADFQILVTENRE